MKEPEYQVYIRNDWPLPFVEPWAWGPTNLAKPPFRWRFILVANLGDKYAWCYYVKDVRRLGHDIDRHLTNPKNLAQFKQQAQKAQRENRELAAKILKINPTKLSIQELSSLLRQWYAAHRNFAARFMPIDATDETLEEDIRIALQNSDIEMNARDLAILLTPEEPTYIQKEHKDFCSLTKRFWEKFDSSLAQKAILRHAEKWWWTSMGWGQHRSLDKKAIRNKLSRIKNVREFLAAQTREESARRVTLNRKKEIIRELPKNVKQLLAAFEVLAAMHDIRKEMQMKMMYAGFSITDNLLKKSGIPLALRNFILVEEYLNLENRIKPSLDELHARKKAYWCQFTSDGKILMLSGKKAVSRIKRSKIGGLENRADNGLIKGISASPGKVQGRVRVELDAKILNRTIKPGEILVTSQTTPEFAPAMKKAVAIITDEGGITSHAAIVSRELRIPCIIGTHHATRILKTGDRVEVDAEKGIVRKI